jgi:hypothetical protein
MGVGLSVPACAGFFHTADLRTPFPNFSIGPRSKPPWRFFLSLGTHGLEYHL